MLGVGYITKNKVTLGHIGLRYYALVIGGYETYLILSETLMGRGKGEREAFRPGIGYASYLHNLAKMGYIF